MLYFTNNIGMEIYGFVDVESAEIYQNMVCIYMRGCMQNDR